MTEYMTPDERLQALHRLDTRDKLVRTLELIVVLIFIGLNLIAVLQLARLASYNQQSALEARQANKARQTDLQDYIKCLSLYRFDVPAAELKTREGVSKALDKCAAK